MGFRLSGVFTMTDRGGAIGCDGQGQVSFDHLKLALSSSEYTDRGGLVKLELGLENNGQAAEKFSSCLYSKSNIELELLPASFG